MIRWWRIMAAVKRRVVEYLMGVGVVSLWLGGGRGLSVVTSGGEVVSVLAAKGEVV